MKKLFLLFILIAAPALAQDVGYFTRVSCDTLTPVANSTVCLQTTSTGGLTAGIIYVWDGAAWVASSGSAGSGHQIQDEGVPLTQRSALDFVGAGVTVTDIASVTTVTIGAGASASGVTFTPNGSIAATDVQAAIQEVRDEAQPLDADLTAVAALATTGCMARTAANTYVMRTLTGTSGNVTVSNGDCVSANPTLDLGATAVQTDQANTYTTGLQDLTLATMKLPSTAGAAPATSGLIQIDSTSWTVEVGLNGVNKTFLMTDGTAATATALAANGANCLHSGASGAIGVDASGAGECAQIALFGAAVPTAGTVEFPGQVYLDSRAYVASTGVGLPYIGKTVGNDFVSLNAFNDAYLTIQGNSGNTTGLGNDTLNIVGDGTILSTTCAEGTPDACTMTVQAASIPPSKLTTNANTSEFTFNLFGVGGSDVITDAQDIPRIYSNEGTTKTITQIKGWVDTGSTTINIQRNDGSAADICTSNLVATSSGVTCTLDGTEKVISNGHSLGLVVVTGATSGTPTHLHLNIKWTKAD